MKVKSLLKYFPAVNGIAFSPKFILDSKVENKDFWKISYSGTFCNGLALNINLKSEGAFQTLKSSENVKSRGRTELEMKICFLRKYWTKRRRQIHKINKIDFFMESFTADFLQFFLKRRQNLAFGWTAGYSSSKPSISGFFLKFSNFLRS